MQILKWVDFGTLSLILGGTILIGFWMLSLKEWSFVGKVIFQLITKSASSTKDIALETLKLANAFKNHSANLDSLIAGCKTPLLRESVLMAREGILDESSLLQVVQSRVNASFLKHSRIASKIRLLAPYPASVGVFGAILCCYFIVQKLIGQNVSTDLSKLLSFGISCLVYGTFCTYFGLYPLSRILNEWAKEQRLNGMLVVVGTKLLIQRANPVLVAEELNSYLSEEDRVDWKLMASHATRSSA